jgi:hypothetical protein
LGDDVQEVAEALLLERQRRVGRAHRLVEPEAERRLQPDHARGAVRRERARRDEVRRAELVGPERGLVDAARRDERGDARRVEHVARREEQRVERLHAREVDRLREAHDRCRERGHVVAGRRGPAVRGRRRRVERHEAARVVAARGRVLDPGQHDRRVREQPGLALGRARVGRVAGPPARVDTGAEESLVAAHDDAHVPLRPFGLGRDLGRRRPPPCRSP